jgi:hypothetical protein
MGSHHQTLVGLKSGAIFGFPYIRSDDSWRGGGGSTNAEFNAEFESVLKKFRVSSPKKVIFQKL